MESRNSVAEHSAAPPCSTAFLWSKLGTELKTKIVESGIVAGAAASPEPLVLVIAKGETALQAVGGNFSVLESLFRSFPDHVEVEDVPKRGWCVKVLFRKLGVLL